MTSTGGTVDPYEAVARRQSYVKKDSFKYFVHASECTTVDDLAQRKGTPKRILWRPPRDFVTQINGAIHGDARGSFAKYIGSKVIIKNKCNGDIRFKATVPVGRMDDPTQIYARPYVTEGTIKPTGGKKDLSRTKGKGKNKREKAYSKATDQATLDITEKFLFTGDANLYTLYEEKIPGDSPTAPTYYAMGKGIADVAIILPNNNQYSGEAYSANLVVAEIIVVTRYIVTEAARGIDAKDVQSIDAFYIGNLNSMDALYHRDVDPLVMGSFGATLTPGTPKTIMLPQIESGFSQIGLSNDNGVVTLNYFKNGKAGKKFKWPEYERTNTRMIVLGLNITSGARGAISQDNTTAFGGLEFGYLADKGCWAVMDTDGTARTFTNFEKGDAKHSYVSVRTPVVLYDVSAPVHAKGMIAHYGSVNARAVSWSAIVSALTITIKVLTFASRVASMFV